MLQSLVDSFIKFLFGLNCDCTEAGILNFFIYNTIRASSVLILVSLLLAFVKSKINTQKLGEFLEKRNMLGLQYLGASMLGAITPFCSCSSISIFIAIIIGKVPFGVACSFLICSPLINELAIAMLISSFGYYVTFAYILTGLIMATFGGYLFDVLGLGKYLVNVDKASLNMCDCAKKRLRNDAILSDSKKSFKAIIGESFKILKSVIFYIIIGIALAALIRVYIPADFFQTYLAKNEILGVPVSVILGVPIYANGVAIIPFVESLVDKGVPLGIAMAFMMSAVGLSLPEMLMLKRVFSIKLILIFSITLAFMITLAGYLFCVLF